MKKQPATNPSVRRSIVIGGAGLLCLLLTVPGCTNESGAQGLLDSISATSPGNPRDRKELDHDVEKPTPSSSGPWPKIVVEETKYDFGRMLLGTKKDHTFTISNEGEAPLQLVSGNATCKCTEFELSEKLVQPGESATLYVQWHGKVEDAAFQHGGSVYTNDPEMTSVRFNVVGIVDVPVTSQPSGKWSAGTIAGDEPVTFEGMVLSHVLPTLTIEDVSVETELTSCEFEPMTESELRTHDAMSGYTFHVTVSPGSASGLQKDTLTIKMAEVDDAMTIPVEASRVGALRLMPTRGTKFYSKVNTLMLGQFPAGKGQEAELMLIVDDQGVEEEFQLTEITANPSSLKVSIEPIGTSTGVVSRYRFKVQVPSGGLRTKHEQNNPATIRCLTNHPSGEEIQLNVVYTSF